MSSTSARLYTAILLIALALRLAQLGGPSLWYDECLTARLTWLLDPVQIAHGTALDVHPPLYYLLIAGWRQFAGSSEAALRFPSVIFGMAALIVWRYIGEELRLSPSVLLLALAFMTISPSLIFYAQELRMYSLLIMAISCALYGVLIESSYWLFFSGVIAMYTHNMAWAYMLAIGSLALIRGWPLRKLAVCVIGMTLIWLPWAYHSLFLQVKELSGGYWIPPLHVGGIAYSLYPLTFFFVPGWAAVHAGALAIGLAILAIWKAIPTIEWRINIWHIPHYESFLFLHSDLPLLIMWLVPIVATAIASWAWQPMYFYRPMIATVPPMLFLLSSAIHKMHKRNAWLLAGLAIPLLTLCLYRHLSDERGLRQPERDNAMIIAENWQEGDCIFHMNVGSAVTQEYYLPDKPQFIWNGPAALFNGALSIETQETLLLDRREFEELPASCKRIWLNWWSNPLTSPDEDKEAERLIAQYDGQKFHTFISNEMVEATLWILERSE